MANLYEALVLAVPEITQDETKHIENELDRVTGEGLLYLLLPVERFGLIPCHIEGLGPKFGRLIWVRSRRLKW